VGDWAEAERVLQASIEAANQLGDNRRRAESTAILGLAMTYQGRFAEGIKLGRQLAHWAEQRGIAQEQVWGLCLQLEGLLADVAPESHHRIAGVIEALEKVLSVDSPRSDRILRADLVWTWGLVAQAKWRIGQEDSAILAAKTTADFFSASQPISYYILSGLGGWAEVEFSVWEQQTLRNRHSSRRARIALKALRSFSRMHPIGQPRFLFFQAKFDWLSKRRRRAIRRLQKSIKLAATLKMNQELVRSKSELARRTGQEP
jgi:tetratricopeptide (TPR) repeat protein